MWMRVPQGDDVIGSPAMFIAPGSAMVIVLRSAVLIGGRPVILCGLIALVISVLRVQW
jgi:hypothetical protein